MPCGHALFFPPVPATGLKGPLCPPPAWTQLREDRKFQLHHHLRTMATVAQGTGQPSPRGRGRPTEVGAGLPAHLRL